ncbi:MAG: MFS transporter [bacterium]|nr:MFS transporter [bacterium]
MSNLTTRQKTNIAILVAALGYFVDVYDLVLFSILRVASLKSLGVTGDKLLSDGVLLLNMQMIGMLVGGILWGVWGDKRGRLQVLFGSILLYSFANIANAFVTSVPQYAVLRFLAGMGLAGEIGAGITLVSELMPKETRGYGTTIVATIGVSGAVVAGLVGDMFSWSTAYIIGGVMGLGLLLLRVSVSESGLFESIQRQEGVRCGDIRLLFSSGERFLRYLSSIVIGIPIWFVVGIIVTFSPEISLALGVVGEIKVSTAVLFCYFGITTGDFASGLVSQIWRSRKKTILTFMLLTCGLSLALLNAGGISAEVFYGGLAMIGFFAGYWAVFVTAAAEQFGTNLRATVTTTVPNFVRGTVVLMTLLFNYLKPLIGVIGSAEVVCLIVLIASLLALWCLSETFGKDLNFVEGDEGILDYDDLATGSDMRKPVGSSI